MNSTYASDRGAQAAQPLRAIQQGELCEPVGRLEKSESRLRSALYGINSELGRLAPSPEPNSAGTVAPPSRPPEDGPGPLNRRLRALDTDMSYLADRAEAALKHLQSL